MASRPTAPSLKASIAAPTADIVFSVDPKDRSCAIEPPGWGGQPIVAGTHVEFEVKYARPDSAMALPIVRIKPETTKFRLVEPGFSTFVARNQVGILLTLLLLALITLFLSVAAGVAEQPAKK